MFTRNTRHRYGNVTEMDFLAGKPCPKRLFPKCLCQSGASDPFVWAQVIFSRSGMYDYVRIGKYMFTYLRSGLVGISGSIVSSSTHQCCSVFV